MKRMLILALVTFSISGCEPAPVEGKRVGNICPDFAGEDADGKIIRFSDFKGKVVLLDFWGTWCPPCRQLIPHEIRMVTQDYKDRPFAMIGIASDSKANLKEFLVTKPLPWPNIADETKLIIDEWSLEVFPSFVLIDHHGIIRHKWFRGVNRDAPEVWKEVAKLVKDAESK